jgi:preprotein translocase subunit Sec61beta
VSILKIIIPIELNRLTNCITAVKILAITLITFAFTWPPQKIESSEYEVKAVFLFNFAQFAEWPAEAFPEGNSPIIIGILGEDPFGSYLDEVVQGEGVNGHPLIIKRFNRSSEINNCHILFIHRSLVPKLQYVLKNLKGKNILTVSDGNNFTKQGGMVRFFSENNKIKLSIDLDAVKAANITISSKLLRLAEIVEPNSR